MFGCCALLPLSFLLVVMPMLSAGRGWRSLARTVVIEIAVLLLVSLLNFESFFEALIHWRTEGMVLFPFIMLFVIPIGMSGLVFYLKRKEEQETGKVCRKCGYDLRATPEQCPECGTAVRDIHSDF